MSDAIARVLVTCPDTGSPVETIMRMKPAAFEALQGEYGFRCRICGHIHTWRREDAWLEPMRR